MKKLFKAGWALVLALGLLIFAAPFSQALAQSTPSAAPAKAEATSEAKAAEPAKANAEAKAEGKAEDKAEAAEAKAEASAPPPPNKGDTAWMLVATLLVVMMSVPGLALFYGGLVRAKNVLSVLMQVSTVFSLIVVLWVVYGYSLAFTGGSPFIGGLDKLFLAGVTADSAGATFSKGVYIPE
ncbi:MAG: ammonia channel protein, partial [Betaproteobacteria bacterium]|nr:ammonia channel protein [Betaproteobacteria bacterium]